MSAVARSWASLLGCFFIAELVLMRHHPHPGPPPIKGEGNCARAREYRHLGAKIEAYPMMHRREGSADAVARRRRAHRRATLRGRVPYRGPGNAIFRDAFPAPCRARGLPGFAVKSSSKPPCRGVMRAPGNSLSYCFTLRIMDEVPIFLARSP